MESKKVKLVKTESRMVVTWGWECGNWGDVIRNYKLAVQFKLATSR